MIRTTAEHPFYAHEKGWVNANQLAVGDWLLTENGQWTVVEDLLDTGECETVYNCRVADYHTYFVGTEAWGFAVWAHNSCTAAQFAANKAKGRAAEQAVLAKLYANPHIQVLGSQVKIRTPGNPNHRTVDILIKSKKTGVVKAIEVKSGAATKTKSQVAKDLEIATGGTAANPTMFFGKRAGPLAGTSTGSIPTFVAHVP